MSRFLDYDPLTGITTTFDYVASEDRTIVSYSADCSAVLDDNKAASLDIDKHRQESKDEWAHYAKIPPIVQYKWLCDHGVNFADKNHWPAVMRLINSPEYRYLKRTSYYHDR